jgi:hypothetical protein
MSVRHWNVNNYHSYDPATDPNYMDNVHEGGLSNSLMQKMAEMSANDEMSEEMSMALHADYPHFEQQDSQEQ